MDSPDQTHLRRSFGDEAGHDSTDAAPRAAEPRSWQGGNGLRGYGYGYGRSSAVGRYGYGRGALARGAADQPAASAPERPASTARSDETPYRQPTGQGGMMNAGMDRSEQLAAHDFAGRSIEASSGDHDFEPDYLHWRAARMRELDRDYLAWREERRRRFSQDFEAWRNRRARGESATTENPDASNGGEGGSGNAGAGQTD